jgi:hypothetical protein
MFCNFRWIRGDINNQSTAEFPGGILSSSVVGLLVRPIAPPLVFCDAPHYCGQHCRRPANDVGSVRPLEKMGRRSRTVLRSARARLHARGCSGLPMPPCQGCLLRKAHVSCRSVPSRPAARCQGRLACHATTRGSCGLLISAASGVQSERQRSGRVGYRIESNESNAFLRRPE